MAKNKYSITQISQEASRRYQNFKSRGMADYEGTVNGRDIFNEFKKEVAAEGRGETYNHPWSAGAYQKKFGFKIDYDSIDTIEDLEQKRRRKLYEALEAKEKDLVEEYKGRIESALDVNDFLAMIGSFEDGQGFSVGLLHTCNTLGELIDFCRRAMQVQPWLFRNKYGRNRKKESDQMETYRNDFIADLSALVQEMNKHKINLLKQRNAIV